MIICCTACPKYIYHLSCLLNSIYKNTPWCKTIVRLVNCGSEHRDQISKNFPHTQIIDVEYKCSTKRNRLLKNGSVLQDTMFNTYSKTRSKFRGSKWLYSEFNAKCINDRYDIILKLLSDGHEHVMSIDADMLIRKDLTKMINECKDADIALHAEIVTRGKHIDHGQYIQPGHIPILSREQYLLKETYHPPTDYVEWHTGVVLFNNTNRTVEFTKKYNEILNSTENEYIWGAEEEEVYFLYTDKFKNKIKLYNLPVKYKDEGYGDDRIVGSNEYSNESYIWVGAGQNKYNAETQYVKELTKYECDDIMCE